MNCKEPALDVVGIFEQKYSKKKFSGIFCVYFMKLTKIWSSHTKPASYVYSIIFDYSQIADPDL